jgi:hypothetical protein
MEADEVRCIENGDERLFELLLTTLLGPPPDMLTAHDVLFPRWVGPSPLLSRNQEKIRRYEKEDGTGKAISDPSSTARPKAQISMSRYIGFRLYPKGFDFIREGDSHCN